MRLRLHMRAQAAEEEGYELPAMPKHLGVPLRADKAASVGDPGAQPIPNPHDENACDEDWPRDPISGQRTFGDWIYDDRALLGEEPSPVEVPTADQAYMIDPSEFEEREELDQEFLNERLLYAALTGQDAWIGPLVQMGAQINLACDVLCGNATALHCAALSEDPPTVRALLSHGADVRKLNVFQQSPLHLAANYGHTDVLMILYRRGALHPPSSNSAYSSSASPVAPGRKRKASGGAAQHSDARALLQLKDVYGCSALDYAEAENRSEAANAIRDLLGMDAIDPALLASECTAERVRVTDIRWQTDRRSVARRARLMHTMLRTASACLSAEHLHG